MPKKQLKISTRPHSLNPVSHRLHAVLYPLSRTVKCIVERASSPEESLQHLALPPLAPLISLAVASPQLQPLSNIGTAIWSHPLGAERSYITHMMGMHISQCLVRYQTRMTTRTPVRPRVLLLPLLLRPRRFYQAHPRALPVSQLHPLLHLHPLPSSAMTFNLVMRVAVREQWSITKQHARATLLPALVFLMPTLPDSHVGARSPVKVIHVLENLLTGRLPVRILLLAVSVSPRRKHPDSRVGARNPAKRTNVMDPPISTTYLHVERT
jgi:hypothetical protein